MDMTRRQFSVAAVAAAACIASVGTVDTANAAPAAAAAPIDVGTAADFPHDGAFDRFAKSNRIMVVRKDNRLYATTATCTHRDCVIKPVQGDLRCPCHGSRFDLAGGVTRGPAKTSLPRYAIAHNSAGRIVVTSRAAAVVAAISVERRS